MVEFLETEAEITIKDIENIENLVGLKFPDQYKLHLQKFNGGRCSPDIFTFNENGRETSSNIDWFLAIGSDGYENLMTHIEIFKLDEKRMPHYMLSIAHDPGGNLVCISCGQEDNGKMGAIAICPPNAKNINC